MSQVIEPIDCEIDVEEHPLEGRWRWTCSVCPDNSSWWEAKPGDKEAWDLDFDAEGWRQMARRYLKFQAIAHMDKYHARKH